MNIELNEKEMKLLIEILEEKLATISITDSASRYDYGLLQSKLELILKSSYLTK